MWARSAANLRRTRKRSWAERQLTVVYETAHALASAATLAEACRGRSAAVCEACGWEYGALWNVDRASQPAALRGHMVAALPQLPYIC